MPMTNLPDLVTGALIRTLPLGGSFFWLCVFDFCFLFWDEPIRATHAALRALLAANLLSFFRFLLLCAIVLVSFRIKIKAD
jgi:hypothetical protein